MADELALRDAERLLFQADSLVSDIDRDIATTEAALLSAECEMKKIRHIGSETGEHIRRVHKEVRSGRILQRDIIAISERANATSRELRERLGAEIPGRSTLPTGSSPSTRIRVTATLPSFRSLTRDRLEKIEPQLLQFRGSVWDEVAEAYPALGDQVEETQALLDEAEALARSALGKEAPPKAEESARTTPRPVKSQPRTRRQETPRS